MPDEYNEWRIIQTILDKHLNHMREMQTELVKQNLKANSNRSRSNSVRESGRKNFKEVGINTNYFHPRHCDYDKIITERNTNIVCEILSDRNRAYWREKTMGSNNIAQTDFLSRGL